MKPLSNHTVGHLLDIADQPDLTGTRYLLVERLGRGGMGAVYLVEDRELGRQVALKVLSDPSPDPDLVNRLLREARHLARLEHPNIVPVHDVGRLADGRPFYVMKYVRGRRLDEWRFDGHSRPTLLRMFQRICEAMAFAHAHDVIHRDLKPENIMVGAFGEALVMDFGVAKSLGDSRGETSATNPSGSETNAPRETRHGAVLGTPGYMAPEQAHGEIEQVDQRSDVYSLGGLLHFLITGQAPRTDRPTRLRQLEPDTPAALESICLKAMAEASAERYPTAQELAADIERFLDGQPVSAHKEGLWGAARRHLARHKVLILLILAYLVMRLLVLLFTSR